MITGLDHIVLGTPNLDRAATHFAQMGFTLAPRGDHPAYGSHNQCITLSDHYIELFAFHDPDKFPAHPMLPVVRTIPSGVVSIAWGADDIPATRTALIADHGGDLPPVNVQRRVMVDKDGTTYDPEFALTMLPPAMMLGLFSFVCRCNEPEKVWRTEWMTHPNGINALTGAAFVCADDRQADSYATALAHFGGVGCQLTTSRETIHIITRAQAACAFGNVACEGLPDTPTVGALFLTTRDFDATCRWLEPHGAQIINDNLTLPAQSGGGCIWSISP